MQNLQDLKKIIIKDSFQLNFVVNRLSQSKAYARFVLGRHGWMAWLKVSCKIIFGWTSESCRGQLSRAIPVSGKQQTFSSLVQVLLIVCLRQCKAYARFLLNSCLGDKKWPRHLLHARMLVKRSFPKSFTVCDWTGSCRSGETMAVLEKQLTYWLILNS